MKSFFVVSFFFATNHNDNENRRGVAPGSSGLASSRRTLTSSIMLLRWGAVAGCAVALLALVVWTAAPRNAPRGLLEKAAASAGDLVFTSVDAKRVYQREIEHAAGREAAFEAKVEALRSLAAKRHDQHEHLLAADEAKDEETVRTLDSRELPHIFASTDGAAALESARKHAAERESKLQANIAQWKKLEDSEHALHEEQIKRTRLDSSAKEVLAQAQQNVARSVLTSAERLRRETEAAKYAAAKEQEFEEKVAGYRKAEQLKIEAQGEGVKSNQGPKDVLSAQDSHAADALTTVGASSRGAGKKGSASLDRALRRDAHLGIAAVEKTLDEQAREKEIERQSDFKKRVKEEARKARETDKQRKKAAASALEKLHAQVAGGSIAWCLLQHACPAACKGKNCEEGGCPGGHLIPTGHTYSCALSRGRPGRARSRRRPKGLHGGNRERRDRLWPRCWRRREIASGRRLPARAREERSRRFTMGGIQNSGNGTREPSKVWTPGLS